MSTLASGLSYLDLHFYGVKGVIAAVILHGPGGAAIIDPGPSSTLPALRPGSRALVWRCPTSQHPADPYPPRSRGRHRQPGHENPRCVYVHEKGAPHDRSVKADGSATRLWGHEMDRLGDMRRVGEPHRFAGGERIAAGGANSTSHTPGHAPHHVSYFSRDTGLPLSEHRWRAAAGGRFIMPPTPPPDIDLGQARQLGAHSAGIRNALRHAFRPVRAGRGSSHRDGGSPRPDERPGEGLAGAAGHRRRSRGVVYGRDPAGTAPPHDRIRRAGVRGCRTVRSELARAGTVRAEDNEMIIWN